MRRERPQTKQRVHGRLKQRSISRDVIAMRVQTGDLVINQRRLASNAKKILPLI
jgi:hypothetical protein